MRRFRVCRTRELVQGGTRFAQDILACKCIKPASQLQDCLAHSRLCTHGVGMSEVWDSSFRCSHQACRIILHLCDDSAQEVLFPLCHHLFSKSRCRGQTQTPHLSIFLANPGGPRARWPLLFPTPPLCKRFRLLSGQFLESYAEASLPARLSAQARRHPAGPRAWSWGATNSASLDLERVQGQVLGWNLALYHFPSPHHKESAWKVHSLGQRLRTLEGRLKTPRRGDQRFYPVYQLHGWTSWSSRSRPPCLVTGSWDHTPPPPPALGIWTGGEVTHSKSPRPGSPRCFQVRPLGPRPTLLPLYARWALAPSHPRSLSCRPAGPQRAAKLQLAHFRDAA